MEGDVIEKHYIDVIYKEVGKNPKVIKLRNQIKQITELVKGKFDFMEYNDILIIFNERQKSLDLKNNIKIDKIDLKGNILIVGNDKESGDYTTLTDIQKRKYIKEFSERMELEQEYE